MKRLLIIPLWLLTTSITLTTSLIFYHTLAQTRGLNSLVAHELQTFAQADNAIMAYAALPTSVAEIRTAVLGADARPVTINNYLQAYKSPLSGYGELIVKVADSYGVDPYLIVAIAQQESNLCKIIPDDSHNCWGWGVHSDGSLKFDSYETAIETVSRGIKEKYLHKGYTTPEEIMTKYTPLSSGSWAIGVSQFLAELNSGNF